MEKVFILFNRNKKVLGVYGNSKIAGQVKSEKEGSFYLELPVVNSLEETKMKSISEMPDKVYEPKHFNNMMPFGKYKGETIGNIIQKDPKYLQWCIDKLNFEVDEDCLELIEISKEKSE